MNGPVVGVTSYDARARWGVWDAPAVLLPETYSAALLGAGASPVVLPVGADPGSLVGRLDGLVLVGGPDVDPSRYGEEPHPLSQRPSVERDAFEVALATAAIAEGLPVLAICRGLQVLNVARGGTLVQHLPETTGHDGHAPGPGRYGRTSVRVVEGSLLHRCCGATELEVDCYHHQAVDRLGSGLVVSGRAADGTVEAVEDPSGPFLLGVQWHPEVGDDPSLFEAFTRACSARGR